MSAYSTLVFVRLDEKPVGDSPHLSVAPGRHWIEAHYAWGAGFLIGVGNFRNYGFELDFLPDHRYAIENVPSGCIVPAARHWVSPKVLQITDLGPTGERQVLEVKALEYCTPSSTEPGTCRQHSDCPSGTCTHFGGPTGFGLCGTLRD